MVATMRLEGKRVREARWIESDRLAVKVMVDAVIPIDDPSEPCFEPETFRFLDEVRAHVDRNDIPWLEKVGTVYVRQTA
jgi:hypothetical protein